MEDLFGNTIVKGISGGKYINCIARILLLSIAFSVMHCTPLSQIRSTRVDSNLRLQTGYTFYSKDGYKILRGYSSDSMVDNLSTLENLLSNLNFGFSFKKKAEARLLLLPLVMVSTYFFLFDLKIPVVHFGQPYLFRNIGVAPFLGSNCAILEWNSTLSGWLGVAIGTHTPVLKGDIELVLQPSITYLDDSYIEQPGRATFTRKSLDLGLGAIYTPFSNGRIGLAMGMTYKHYYYNLFFTDKPTVHLAAFENDPLSFYTFISFSLVK